MGGGVMELLLCVNILMLFILAILNMALYVRVTRSDRERKADDKVQDAMDEAAEDEARRSRAMDEGFDNVMSYSVKLGRGKTTGGEL